MVAKHKEATTKGESGTSIPAGDGGARRKVDSDGPKGGMNALESPNDSALSESLNITRLYE